MLRAHVVRRLQADRPRVARLQPGPPVLVFRLRQRHGRAQRAYRRLPQAAHLRDDRRRAEALRRARDMGASDELVDEGRQEQGPVRHEHRDRHDSAADARRISRRHDGAGVRSVPRRLPEPVVRASRPRLPRARVLRARPVADPRHRGEGHDALQLDSVPAPSVHD